MSAENLLSIQDRGGTAVERPNLEETGRALEDRPGIRSVALTGLFVLAVFYTLYFAREFFIPVTLAVVFNFLLSPFVRALKRLRIPEAAGAGLVMIAGFGILALVVYEFSAPVAQWVGARSGNHGKISTEMQRFRKPVDKVTQATEQVRSITSPGNQGQKPPQVEIKSPDFTDGLFTKTRDTLFGLAVLVVLLYFLLSSGDLFLRKLVRVLPTFKDQKRAVLIMRQIEDHISKYLITVAMINAGLGTCGGIRVLDARYAEPGALGRPGLPPEFHPLSRSADRDGHPGAGSCRDLSSSGTCAADPGQLSGARNYRG